MKAVTSTAWPLPLVAALCAVFALAACPDDPTGTADVAVTPDGSDGDAVDADAGPDAAPTPTYVARNLRRMTLDQIRTSIATVTGGIVWTETFNEGDLLVTLGPTIGEPDYLLVTEENLEPTLILAKFMADMSKRVCVQWANADVAKPLAERTFVSTQEDWFAMDEASVRANLRRLYTRFFGRMLADDGSQDGAIDAAYTAFVTGGQDQATAQQQAYMGWMAVCIAYFTDPDFVTY